MFEPSTSPRIFSSGLGIDFAQNVVDGLTARCHDLASADWARIEIYVNTTRMQRRIRAVFDRGPARLLTRIRLVKDLADDPISLDLPPAVSPLTLRLDLSQFFAKLLL